MDIENILDRISSLYDIISQGYSKIIELLLNTRINLESINFYDRISFIEVIDYDKIKIINLLLNININTKIQDILG
jgi:hypothetical protein